MTDDLKTPLSVAGYTSQPDEKIALVNVFKQDEERLLRKLDARRQPFLGRDGRWYTDSSETVDALDPRWAAIARTHFQEGFMALNRAVFQPQRVKLPEDE